MRPQTVTNKCCEPRPSRIGILLHRGRDQIPQTSVAPEGSWKWYRRSLPTSTGPTNIIEDTPVESASADFNVAASESIFTVLVSLGCCILKDTVHPADKLMPQANLDLLS